MNVPRYFSVRWRAEVPFTRLFWRDLLVWGSLLNLSVLIAGLMLIAKGYPTQWALVAHLLILPYNLFLVLSIWRWPKAHGLFKGVAGGWLLLMSLA